MELIYVAYADNMVSDRAGRGDAVQKNNQKCCLTILNSKQLIAYGQWNLVVMQGLQ